MNKKILIVEDESDLRELLKLVLKGEGFDVNVLSTGDRLLQDSYEPPDLYIIDVNLPGISGLEICSHLKANDDLKHIPVIMISANPELAALAKSACADDSIAKPLNKENLLNKVNYYIR